MIIDGGRGRRVRVRYRDPDTLERIEDSISDQYPYFFALTDEIETVKWPYYATVLRTVEGFEGVYGETLSKVVVREPKDIGLIKKSNVLSQTWEGNIPWGNRVLSDRISAGEEPYRHYKHRVWYFDAEWKTESNEITIMTVYDTYTEKRYTWFTHPDYEAGEYNSVPCKNHPDGKTETTFDVPAKCFSSELAMLKHFLRHMQKQDPDIIAGWFLVTADIKTIVKRMEVNGLNPGLLSPYNSHVRKYNWTASFWAQPIPGRICMDLMVSFGKLWVMKNGQLPGQGLDAVSRHCLNESKVELSDGHDTYYTDIGTYLDYNIQDVMLLPRLNDLVNCIDYFTSLQHFCQCDFETVAKTTGLATALFLRDKDFTGRIPTEPQFAKVNYTGADIQEPTPGLYNGTAILDIKAMYHSNVNLHNICWTTLSDNGRDCGNGICFDQDKTGLLGRTMDYLTIKRDEYKQKLKGATTKGDKNRWDAMQFATKSLIASLYGVSGDSRYGLYNPNIAAAITYTSRQTLFKLRDECVKRGHEVIYGHTDSIFCSVDSPEKGIVLNAELNKSMAPIVVEFEKFSESIILKAKNRYAGKITWGDGEYLSEPDYYIKGIEVIQARMPSAMKKSIMGLMKGMLDGQDEDIITSEITARIIKYVAGEQWEDLLMYGKLKKKLWEYKTLSGPSAGAEWALHNLNHEFKVGESFLIALDTRGRYMSFPNLDWLPKVKEKSNIGYEIMARKFIVDKAQDLYEIVGWDYQPLHNALEGKSGVEWL
tara:strand:- start:251 stop:2539 length:2289 start_codon:yes stop_codon:yes gene_type:complete